MAWIKTKTTASGEKRYKVQYCAPNGRTLSKTFQRYDDARQFARDVENSKRRGEYLDPARGRATVAEVWPQFLASSRNLRPKTRELYEGLARNHILPVLGQYRLGTLTTADVNTFVSALERRGARPPTIHSAFRLLRSFLSFAEADGRIVKNPAQRSGRSRIELPEVHRDEMRFLSPPEVFRLADEIQPRYRALVMLLGFCGLRVGEALALRNTDLELLRRRLSVTRTLSELNNGQLVFGAPKTKASRRSIALPSFVCDEIAAHIAEHGLSDEGLIFSAARGGAVHLKRFRREVWAPAVKAAELEPLRIHDLRHTAVAIAIRAGAHPKLIQAMCGHSSITITLDRYGHVFDSAAEELATRLDEIGREAAVAAGAISVPADERRVVVPMDTDPLTSGDAGIRTREGAQHPLTA